MNDEELGAASLLLGTVVEKSYTGVRVRLDGDDEALIREFPAMWCGGALLINDRVVIAKMSGTYLVLGRVADPQPRYYLNPLASNATLADVISAINTLEGALNANRVTIRR